MIKITALSGSGRSGKTNSHAILVYLKDQLDTKQFQCTIFNAFSITKNQKERTAFERDLVSSNLLIVCAPVYLDTISHSLTVVLEKLASTFTQRELSGKKFLTIAHSGYTDISQRELIIRVLKNFAVGMEMRYLGALSFGGTSPIGGRPLAEVGYFSKQVRNALEKLARHFKEEVAIPENALAICAKKPFPNWFACYAMNIVMKRKAKTKGYKDVLYKPYPEAS